MPYSIHTRRRSAPTVNQHLFKISCAHKNSDCYILCMCRYSIPSSPVVWPQRSACRQPDDDGHADVTDILTAPRPRRPDADTIGLSYMLYPFAHLTSQRIRPGQSLTGADAHRAPSTPQDDVCGTDGVFALALAAGGVHSPCPLVFVCVRVWCCCPA